MQDTSPAAIPLEIRNGGGSPTADGRITKGKAAGMFLSGLMMIGAVTFFIRTFDVGTIRQMGEYMGSLTPLSLIAGAAFAAASYGMLTLYDYLAFRYLGNPLPYRSIAFCSFVSFSFSNNVGLSFISGGSMRYRLYSHWGVCASDILKITGMGMLTFLLGFVATMGSILSFAPHVWEQTLGAYGSLMRFAGFVLLGALTLYILAGGKNGRSFTLYSKEIVIPSAGVTLAQVFISTVDWFCIGTLIYMLLPIEGLSYFFFVHVFLLAHLTGLFSNVPGGIGVFEATLLLLLSSHVPEAALLATLLAYRGIYYLVPLCVGMLLYCLHEYRRGDIDLTRLRLAFSGTSFFGAHAGRLGIATREKKGKS